MKQNKNIMKKLSSILLALIFTTSFTMSAQDTADNTQKKTETKTECSDTKVKESKKVSGFNFTKTNTYGKSSCSKAEKEASCSKPLPSLHVVKVRLQKK